MKLSDLFKVYNGIATSGLDISPIKDEHYNIPFLRPSSRALNSIAGYISSNEIDDKYIFNSNSLYVSTNGQGSHSYSYVYPTDFSANSDIAVLIPKKEMSLDEKLFYAAIITLNRYKFSYGRKPKGNRLKNLIVPDKFTIAKKIQSVNNNLKDIKSPQKINSQTNNVLKHSEWKNFKLNFKLGLPLHSKQLEPLEKGIPYVTRTTFNNGIEFHVNEDDISNNYINEGNCITIGAEGFKAFYQPNKFITGNKINIFTSVHLNKYNALFLCSILNKEIAQKFNYGRGATKQRLNQLDVKLPSKNKEPDWTFMENYIKSLPYSSSL